MNDVATKTSKAVEKPRKAATEPTAWSPFASLRKEIDRLFDDFSVGWPSLAVRRPRLDFEPFSFREGIVLQPAVDVKEGKKAYTITAELPGLEEKDIEVTVTDGGICIRGEKSEEKEEEKDDYHLSERRYGSFERRFRLPDGVDADKIEAHMKKGVLTVSLPKTVDSQKKMRKVSVKSKD